MKIDKNKTFLISVLLLSGLLLSVCVCLNVSAKTISGTANKQIIIELDYIPAESKPGDKPITLTTNLLSKLLPELRNPRLMSSRDLDSDEQESFLEGGYAFVLRGDLNRDGFADIAFVGKYDKPDNPDKNCFIAIMTIKGKTVVREFFSKIQRDRISLLRAINYKPKIDAIVMSYNLASDDCGYLYWTGKKWQYDACKADF